MHWEIPMRINKVVMVALILLPTSFPCLASGPLPFINCIDKLTTNAQKSRPSVASFTALVNSACDAEARELVETPMMTTGLDTPTVKDLNAGARTRNTKFISEMRETALAQYTLWYKRGGR